MIEINIGKEDNGAMTRFTKVRKALSFLHLTNLLLSQMAICLYLDFRWLKLQSLFARDVRFRCYLSSIAKHTMIFSMGYCTAITNHSKFSKWSMPIWSMIVVDRLIAMSPGIRGRLPETSDRQLLVPEPHLGTTASTLVVYYAPMCLVSASLARVQSTSRVNLENSENFPIC